MSWSVSAQGTKAEVRAVIANSYAPPAVKGVLLEAVEKYPDTRILAVSGHGHTFEGGGSYDVSEGTYKVNLIERRASA